MFITPLQRQTPPRTIQRELHPTPDFGFGGGAWLRRSDRGFWGQLGALKETKLINNLLERRVMSGQPPPMLLRQ